MTGILYLTISVLHQSFLRQFKVILNDFDLINLQVYFIHLGCNASFEIETESVYQKVYIFSEFRYTDIPQVF